MIEISLADTVCDGRFTIAQVLVAVIFLIAVIVIICVVKTMVKWAIIAAILIMTGLLNMTVLTPDSLKDFATHTIEQTQQVDMQTLSPSLPRFR